MTVSRFQVRKSAISQGEFREQADQPLAAGQVRVNVDRFALTSNNITYAAFGDAMHYWDFYPSGEDGWGCIPVWGFGDVVQSLHPGVAVGERLYGYYPMASSLVLTPTRLTPGGFAEGSAHRTPLPAVYNQYLRCASDPLYTRPTEDLQALVRPLFTTSWLIDDFLADNAWFGAGDGGNTPVLLLSSASSKTAYGTAFVLAQRQGVQVVGLTSAANVAFCESLGCYHRVLSYEQLDQVDAVAHCIYVDFAGNSALRLTVHSRFANLLYSCAIGGTHVQALQGAGKLPGPKAVLFFAPTQVKKRHAEWGAAEFGERLARAWQAFVATVDNPSAPWLTVQQHRGKSAVASAYQLVLSGKADPRAGHILSMRD